MALLWPCIGGGMQQSTAEYKCPPTHISTSCSQCCVNQIGQQINASPVNHQLQCSKRCCYLSAAEPAPSAHPLGRMWPGFGHWLMYLHNREGWCCPPTPPQPQPTHTTTTITMRAPSSTLLYHVFGGSQKFLNHTKAVECGGQDLHWQIKETVLQGVLWHAACITIWRPARCTLKKL
jgi:hypothetical protein